MKFLVVTIMMIMMNVSMAADNCYSLYMRENSDDPALACFSYEQTQGVAIADSVELLTIDRHVTEKISLQYSILDSGLIIVKGKGNNHSLFATQVVPLNGVQKIELTSLIDGHVQTSPKFDPPKQPVPCRPGRCR